MVELLQKLRKVPNVKTISAQSNGMLLDEEKIKAMAGLIDRVNLSVSSLDERTAQILAGTKKYDVEHVKEVAVKLLENGIDVLLAPSGCLASMTREMPRSSSGDFHRRRTPLSRSSASRTACVPVRQEGQETKPMRFEQFSRSSLCWKSSII
jgi:hypothetical protein